jgi:hypothetical protein
VLYKDGQILREDAAESAFQGCGFTQVDMNNLVKCTFSKCNFDRCNWEGTAISLYFEECRMHLQDFSAASLARVDFRDCDLTATRFSNGTLFEQVAFWNVRGLQTSWRLHDVKVIPGEHHAFQIELDRCIKHSPLPRLTRRTSWTVLRSFGKLPFFGVSYTGLVSIPTAMFLMSVFNDQMEHLKAWGERSGGVTALLVADLRPVPVPSLNLLAAGIFGSARCCLDRLCRGLSAEDQRIFL